MKKFENDGTDTHKTPIKPKVPKSHKSKKAIHTFPECYLI